MNNLKKICAIFCLAMMIISSSFAVYANELPPLCDHTASKDWSYDENQHWHVCTACQAKLSPEDHVWAGSTCSVCGYVDQGGGSDEHTHTAGKTWNSDGQYHWHTCTYPACGKILDKASHTWNSGVVTKQPSVTANGEKTFTCTVCGATKTEIVLKVNPLKVSASKKTYKAKVLKKSKKSFTVNVTKFKGKVTYSLDPAAKAAKIKVKKQSSSSGKVKYKITVPKKCKKGTYKITVKAAGNDSYGAGEKVLKIKVK